MIPSEVKIGIVREAQKAGSMIRTRFGLSLSFGTAVAAAAAWKFGFAAIVLAALGLSSAPSCAWIVNNNTTNDTRGDGIVVNSPKPPCLTGNKTERNGKNGIELNISPKP